VDNTLTAQNDDARERLASLIARLSDDELRHPLDGGWTVAASLAHLAFWDRRALYLLERWEREGPGPSPYDVHLLNDTLLAQWLLIPPRDAANDWLAAAEAIDSKIAALPPDQIEAIRTAGAINVSRAHHRLAHLAEIEGALGVRR
jgi:hypothetical protein